MVRVSLGFRDRVRVRVTVRVSFRLATLMYSVWPPVSLRVRVSLGFRDKVRVSVLVRVRVSLGFRVGMLKLFIFLKPVAGLPKPVFYRLPKGLL